MNSIVYLVVLALILGSAPKTASKFFRGFSSLAHPFVHLQQLQTPDAGMELTFPPPIAELVQMVKSSGLKEVALAPGLHPRLAMHFAVGVYPIEISKTASARVFAASDLGQITQSKCQVSFLKEEVGFAVCPSGDSAP